MSSLRTEEHNLKICKDIDKNNKNQNETNIPR
jgi:hypothetical protein